MVELTYQMVLSTLQTVGLLVGIFYYIITLRNTQKTQQMQLETRKSQHYLQMLQTVSTEEFIKRTMTVHQLEFKDYEDYLAFSNNYDSDMKWQYEAYMTWLNGFGLMLKEGLIDTEVILSFGQGIQYIRAWEKWKPIILKNRERSNLPQLMEGIEFLAVEMERVRKMKGIPSMWSEDLGKFIPETET